jgi:hypothetical protein
VSRLRGAFHHALTEESVEHFRENGYDIYLHNKKSGLSAAFAPQVDFLFHYFEHGAASVTCGDRSEKRAHGTDRFTAAADHFTDIFSVTAQFIDNAFIAFYFRDPDLPGMVDQRGDHLLYKLFHD